MKKGEKYPEGRIVGMWMAIGILIFSVIGIPLSIITGNPGFMGVGPAIGVAIGLAVGQGIENKYKKQGKIRPLTKQEKKKKQGALVAGIIVLIILVILGLVMFLLRS